MKDLIFFGLGVWVGMQLVKSQCSQTTTPPPLPDPGIPDQTKVHYTPDRIGALTFFPSYLLGARPQQPYQVRWGTGIQQTDTTKKAQLVI